MSEDICGTPESVRILRAAHYHLMRSKRFWYDEADKAASMILCVLASDICKEIREAK